MITFPNCKINIGLRILDTRDDGYHNIESVFFPVNWCDALEIIPSKDFFFESKGVAISGSIEDNLCVKAYRLLQKEFNLPPVKIFLLKNIPLGSGLGGGSSDAAFALKMLNEIFELKLSDDALKNFAGQLGSDCVFFIENRPCMVRGKGELLQPVDLHLTGYYVIIICPLIEVNSGLAYNELDKVGKLKMHHEWPMLNNLPVENWKDHLANDFEKIIFKKYPEIAAIKKYLYESGAVYASMSGSGSAVYGFFDRQVKLEIGHEYMVYEGWLNPAIGDRLSAGK